MTLYEWAMNELMNVSRQLDWAHHAETRRSFKCELRRRRGQCIAMTPPCSPASAAPVC